MGTEAAAKADGVLDDDAVDEAVLHILAPVKVGVESPSTL